MTHPLTPREKVASFLKERDEACGMIDADDAERDESAGLILTALASGSGDHAELARLADMADWMADGDPGANGSVLLSASVASEHASDLKGLLAEIAALRAAKWEVKHVDTMNDMVLMGLARDEAETRATEAERKLAEAVGLMRVTLGDLDRRDVTAETANRIDHFISKEAERG